MNTFGQLYRLTTFGESHGPALGGVIDGMPAGVKIDMEAVRAMLARRRPGQSPTSTPRREDDEVELLSGIFEGVTIGTPIGFVVRNSGQRSADYERLRHVYRPSHADFTYQAKYGVRDFRGGGRASARETVGRVVGGAIAMQALATLGVTIEATVESIGKIQIVDPERDMERAREAILEAKGEGDSLGGVVKCTVNGCQPGLGEPVFGKLQARLAAAMMSIPAAKGFEYGMGFEGSTRRGSEVIDEFTVDDEGHVVTATNFSGGIQGGISNGMPITMRVAFKPVASLRREVTTVDDSGREVKLVTGGRHDPCVVERALPIVEAMAAMTIFDEWLINRNSRM